jgi:hypothetical protein
VVAWQIWAGSRPAGLALFLLGLLVIIGVQLTAMSAALILGVLRGRANLTFLPIRDYRHFVKDISKTFEVTRVD